MKKLLTTLLFVSVLAGCAATPSQPREGSPGYTTLSPIQAIGQSALPPGATFRPERSLIIGSGDQWLGRVVADVVVISRVLFVSSWTSTRPKAGH